METPPSSGPDREIDRRRFLGVLGVAAAGIAVAAYSSPDKAAVPEDFSSDKEVEMAVAEVNRERPVFDQIAASWKEVAKMTAADYPENTPEAMWLRNAKAQYKNFPEIRGSLMNIHMLLQQYETCEMEFADALKEKNKKKTLDLKHEMHDLLEALQTFVLEASRIPDIDDYVAWKLEGQRSA